MYNGVMLDGDESFTTGRDHFHEESDVGELVVITWRARHERT